MTRVGWLVDDPGYVGGAELTQAAFRAGAPDGVTIVDCPPGAFVDGLDAYCIHNCFNYQAYELPHFDAPAWKYHHDVGPHLRPETWKWLTSARNICVSPLQREKMGFKAHYVPPVIDLERFREAARNAGERKGAVAVARWWPDKGADAAAAWAAGNGGIDFYGPGPCAPPGSREVSQDELPEILARYKTFVHLPRTHDPCPRGPIEAWAAGCEVVLNRLVGSRYWIEEAPEKLDTAAEDFWNLVLETKGT